LLLAAAKLLSSFLVDATCGYYVPSIPTSPAADLVLRMIMMVDTT
jgi:hypothetical protein